VLLNDSVVFGGIMPVVNVKKDPDLGIVKFTFLRNGKAYTVVPKGEEGYSRIDAFHKFIHIPGINPFTYTYKHLFDIRPAGSGDKEKEQYDFSSIKEELKNKNIHRKDLQEKEKNTRLQSKLKKINKPIKNSIPPEGEQMSLFASDRSVVNRVLLKYSSYKG
jgi:hypothetical protein